MAKILSKQIIHGQCVAGIYEKQENYFYKELLNILKKNATIKINNEMYYSSFIYKGITYESDLSNKEIIKRDSLDKSLFSLMEDYLENQREYYVSKGRVGAFIIRLLNHCGNINDVNNLFPELLKQHLKLQNYTSADFNSPLNLDQTKDNSILEMPINIAGMAYLKEGILLNKVLMNT